jgi:hypothetical protein
MNATCMHDGPRCTIWAPFLGVTDRPHPLCPVPGPLPGPQSALLVPCASMCAPPPPRSRCALGVAAAEGGAPLCARSRCMAWCSRPGPVLSLMPLRCAHQPSVKAAKALNGCGRAAWQRLGRFPSNSFAARVKAVQSTPSTHPISSYLTPSHTSSPPQATSDAKFADYKPSFAFFFPGQGAQSVGMAKVGLALCWLFLRRGGRARPCRISREPAAEEAAAAGCLDVTDQSDPLPPPWRTMCV